MMNMFINKQRRPNLSRPSFQPTPSGGATPDPPASSNTTFQQQRSKRKPVDQHDFLRSLIKDFVKLAHCETVREKAQMAYEQNKKLQEDIGRWSEVEPDAPQASSANLSALQEYEPLIRENLDSATAQIAQLEAQILDKSTQMNAGLDALADAMANASLSPNNVNNSNAAAKSEGGGTVESADENHWTRAENKFNPGIFPESAPGWLKSELSHLHGAIKTSKSHNDSLNHQVAELKNEVALLRSQLGQVSAKSSSSHYVRTPSAGYGGGSRSVYLSQEPEAPTTPKVASAGMTDESNNKSSWGASDAGASTSGWGAPSAADSWDAGAQQSGADDEWGAPLPPPPQPQQAPAASTSTEPSGASPRTQRRDALSSSSSSSSFSAVTPRPASGAPALQRKRSSGSGKVRSSDDIDLLSCDTNQSFTDQPAQLETVRNIAKKVTELELRNYDSQHVSAHNDRRKGDIARCNSRIEDLRVRVKVVEEMLNIEPETEVIAKQHSEGQQRHQHQPDGGESVSGTAMAAGGQDTDMTDAQGQDQQQQVNTV